MISADERDKYVTIFCDEALEEITIISNLLIELEKKRDDKELLSEIKRRTHNLKGSSKMVGLSELSEIAHTIEDKFIQLEQGQTKVDGDFFDLVFAGLDRFSNKLDESCRIKEGGDSSRTAVPGSGKGEKKEELKKEELKKETEENTDEINFEAAKEKNKKDEAKTGTAEIKKAPEQRKKKGSAGEDVPNYRKINIRQADNSVRVAIDVLNKLVGLSDEVYSAGTDLDNTIREGVEIESLLLKKHAVFNDIENDIFEICTKSPKLRRRLSGFLDNLEQYNEYFVSLKDNYDRFFRNYKNMSGHLHDLHQQMVEKIAGLRLVPVGEVFGFFPRLIRETAQHFDKEIDLVVEGSDVLIDKKVLERIKDPLVHILRNCVDHGIEDSAERLKKGKKEAGTITISAVSHGEYVIINIADDGRGIDLEKIKAKALDKGLISSKELKSQTFDFTSFIFMSGFSTASAISEISGRGVGMDVVKESIERLNGEIIIKTRKDMGTAFCIKLPLTIAVIHAVVFKISSYVLSVPVSPIESILVLKKHELKKIKNNYAFLYNDMIVQLYNLGDILQIENKGFDNDELPIVIISNNNKLAGFLVDEILTERSLVLQAIKGVVGKTKIISGASVLDRNELILVLNVPEVIKATQNRQQLQPVTRAVKKSGEEKKLPEVSRRISVLLAEDSFTIRELERSILESNNFAVDAVADGASAFKNMEKKKYDLLITDIDMPYVNGLELVKKIKADKKLASIPIIMLTTHEEREIKEKAMALGVNTFITKGAFERQNLLNVIGTLLH